jgi:hypothetical protein
MAKVGRHQSRQEVREHLAEQVDFIRSSVQRFDQGHLAEAKRLAVHLRILLRDSGGRRPQVALLTQLGSDFHWRFVDSVVVPLDFVGPTSPYHGLAAIRMEANESGGKIAFESLFASGEVEPPNVRRAFSDWWPRMVMRDAENRRFSRADLVLTVANQDGGAHVDPTLDEDYAGCRVITPSESPSMSGARNRARGPRTPCRRAFDRLRRRCSGRSRSRGLRGHNENLRRRGTCRRSGPRSAR